MVDSHPPKPKGADSPPLKAKGVVGSHPPRPKGAEAEPAQSKPALKSLFRPLSRPTLPDRPEPPKKLRTAGGPKKETAEAARGDKQRLAAGGAAAAEGSKGGKGGGRGELGSTDAKVNPSPCPYP